MNPFYVIYGFVIVSYNTEIAVCKELPKSKLTVVRATPLMLTPVDIMAVFKHSGIFPSQPKIFTDSHFYAILLFRYSCLIRAPIRASPNLKNTNNPEKLQIFLYNPLSALNPLPFSYPHPSKKKRNC